MIHWITVAIMAILFATQEMEDLHVFLGTVLGVFLIVSVFHGFFKIFRNKTSALATTVQSLMLCCLAVITITGYLDMEDIHESFTWVFVVFLSLHVLGAIRKWSLDAS